MADVFIGEANFQRQAGGTMAYVADVLYEEPANVFNIQSRVIVAVDPGETGATFNAKLRTAVDAEAVRLGLAATTRCFGNAITKFW